MLQLHLPTLLLANTAVVSLCGLLMMFSWWRGRDERALLWTGGMLWLAALGLVLNALRGLGADWLPIVLGNVVLLTCAAMNWTVMRVFSGRAPHYPGLLAGALCWLLLCLWPSFYADLWWRVVAHTLLASLYMLAALAELWRSRRQLEVSVLPAMALAAIHLILLLLRMVFSAGVPADGQMQVSPLFPLLLIESMLYAVGIAFVVLSMVKERVELRYRQAAYHDALTGIGNRRAFLEAGERLLGLCRRQRQPVALLLCDLDRFKAINDRLGHPEGDRVLKAFATEVAQRLRKGDVFGRIGGEEFACLLAGDAAEARALAERIRVEFAALAPSHREQSVSIGVATSAAGGYDLAHLLALADQALYRAKQCGRNRVELYLPASAGDAASG